MNMKILTTSILWLLALVASANDGVYYVSGAQIVPLQETDVAVTKEVLTITITDDEFACVDVQYEFTNRGKAKVIDVGFEASAPMIREVKVLSTHLANTPTSSTSRWR